MKKVILLLTIVGFLFILSGCQAPESRSDLPWTKPESWETGLGGVNW